jgi:hypothetical protein
MRVWMLSQHYQCPVNGTRPVCDAYSNGHLCPRYADDVVNGWSLVQGDCSPQQIDASLQDPRVQAYRTVWDTITPETVTAYAAQGATAGMMLCQLLSLLAKWEPGFGVPL